jgi:hypothetical protein
MSELYSEIKPKTWLELKDWYWALGAGIDWVFRGQRDEKWDISSSLERAIPASWDKATKKNKKEIGDFLGYSESKLFDKFSERVDQFASTGEAAADSVLGKLALMQHHGVPTRLIDWTESPYVATFFAVDEANDPEKDCAVWAISSEWCQERSAAAVRKKLKLTKEQFSNREDFSLDNILAETVLKGTVPLVAPLRPLKLNTRIASQQGLFLCPGDLNMTFMENLRALGESELPTMLFKFIFPASWRPEIFHDLFNMNIGPQTLFPGLDGFAKSIKLKMNWETESFEYLQYVRDTAAKDFKITYYVPEE